MIVKRDSHTPKQQARVTINEIPSLIDGRYPLVIIEVQ